MVVIYVVEMVLEGGIFLKYQIVLATLEKIAGKSLTILLTTMVYYVDLFQNILIKEFGTFLIFLMIWGKSLSSVAAHRGRKGHLIRSQVQIIMDQIL